MTTRPIYKIAEDIYADWKNPFYGAVPYLSVMARLKTLDDYYRNDSAKEIITYFLANASTWRGPVARVIKKELKELTK
jgi:hypothetical protein